MINSITKAQYNELSDANFIYGTETFHKLLEEYTGIKAVPYTVYAFYDAAGDYVGCSENNDLDHILQSAYISVDEVTCSNCKYHCDNDTHFCKKRNEECPDDSEYTCKYAILKEK